MEKNKFDAIVLDTSSFMKEGGLRLDSGLLGKMHQFRGSAIEFIMPDVIYNEVNKHLQIKINLVHEGYIKSLKGVNDYITSALTKKDSGDEIPLYRDHQIPGLAEEKLKEFILNTNATLFKCGDHLDISILLDSYFANKPPFAVTGNKKHEFPDAIVLMALEAWASKGDKKIIMVSEDGDWKNFCNDSSRLIYEQKISTALDILNRQAPLNTQPALDPKQFSDIFAGAMESQLNSMQGNEFLDKIKSELTGLLDGFTPEQDADSAFYWEPDGVNGWLAEFELCSNKVKIIEVDEEYVVVSLDAQITVEVDGDFSLYSHDSIDRDMVRIDSVRKNKIVTFESEILVTTSGDFEDANSSNIVINELAVEEVEIVTKLKSVHFGNIEPDFDHDD